MENLDLFSTLQQGEDSYVEANELPPVTQCDIRPSTSRSELMDFVEKYKHRLWKGDQHGKLRSVAQAHKFADHLNQPSLPLKDINAGHIMSFLDDLRDTGASASTANRYAATISSIFKYAVKMKVTTEVPHVPFEEEPEGRIATYTDQQIDGFISHFYQRGDIWMAEIIRLAANTGLRKGEIEKLMDDTQASLCHQTKTFTIFRCKNGKPRTCR